MSEIDSFNHGLIGTFNGIATYLLHEDAGKCFFNAKAGSILIGGGSGEHPAMLLLDNNQTALDYIEALASYLAEGGDKKWIQFEKQVSKAYENLCPDPKHYFDLLQYNWNMADVAKFNKGLTELHNPFKAESMEWLTLFSFGELIIFSLPHLLRKDVQKFVNSIKDKIRPVYYNVKIDPPGYPITGGKKLVTHHGTSTVKWGVSAYENNKI